MTTEQSASAVQRKLAAATSGKQTGERTALRALRLGLARAATAVCDLPVAVIGATQRRADSDDVADYIRDDWLLLLLDGPGGQIGAMLFCPDSIASLIQHQTMGAVSGGTDNGRPFTETDAAMVAPLVDGMLQRASDLVQVAADVRCLTAYRFGARSEDARSLALTLEADQYRVFELSLDFAGGIAQGNACLILPEPPEPEKPKTRSKSGPCLNDAIGGAKAELQAVICRMRIPLAELSAMSPGDVVPLSMGRFDKTELLAISGQPVTSGQLGQAGGFRAVRLAGFVPQLAAIPDDFDLTLDLPAPVSEPVLNSIDIESSVLSELEPDTKTEPLSSSVDEDALFAGLSEDEVVLEISELAGLDLTDPADESEKETSDS